MIVYGNADYVNYDKPMKLESNFHCGEGYVYISLLQNSNAYTAIVHPAYEAEGKKFVDDYEALRTSPLMKALA